MIKLLRGTSATLLIALACGIVGFAITQTEKDIQSIRQAYAGTNRKLARYRKVKKELSGFSTEGGELFILTAMIVRINATYLGESGRAYEEYYSRREIDLCSAKIATRPPASCVVHEDESLLFRGDRDRG